ncbi:MAG: restriction endonuclease [Nitrosopumilaceae archaeon]|nr:restriction endonuclease [Nitrosopumilaceae archaeon]
MWLGSTTGLAFEGVCADILEGCGFTVHRMGGTGDGGRDIIMWIDRRKVVVECKHQTKPVGRPVVQKLHSAVMTEKAVGGVVHALRAIPRCN